MKTIAPNTVLPKGGSLLNPVLKKKVGGWVEMDYDAKCERHGLTLLRVKGGMGNSGDSEAWVVDTPSGCISIHDYAWREPRWGFDKYDSFDEAVTGQITSAIAHIKDTAAEYQDKADRARRAVALLQAAIA